MTHTRLKAGEVESTVEAGQTEWLAVGTKRLVDNRATSPAEVLLFEFKTKPVGQRQ